MIKRRKPLGRRLRYGVAVSLDGFIAGPKGEFDWILMDPMIDFGAMYRQFDTAVMGRKTYEVATGMGEDGRMPGIDVVVFSRTLPPSAKPGLSIINDDPRRVVETLKAAPGGDIWLFGGGELCRTLLDAGLVDTMEVALIPIVLSAGVPLVAPGAPARLVLSDHKVLPKTGIVVLSYALEGSARPAPPIAYIKDKARPGRKGRTGATTSKRGRARR